MKVANNWKDYELLEMKNGMKKERWGEYVLVRPDPQIIWTSPSNFNDYDAIYHRSNKGGGHWEYKRKLKDNWQVRYKDLTFNIKPMGFKHTGLFPEQAVNWDYMIEKIRNANRSIKVLNLFAYTGGATVACLYAGASVCHVDSSKGMVAWAKENVISSNLQDRPVRYIVDDVVKFVEREIRRGNKYDAIVMDPPSYGRGTNGEVWDIEKDLYNLVSLCSKLLSDKPLFFIINSYTSSLSSSILKTILKMIIKEKGTITDDEIALPLKSSDITLPCGVYARWESND